MARVTVEAFSHVIADRHEMFPGLAAEVVATVFDQLADLVARGDQLHVRGLGVFTTKRVGGRTVTHPTTGVQYEVEPHRAPAFRPADSLRKRTRKATAE